MNDRRKADRRIPPSVAQHAIEERTELLARIEEQAREIERLIAFRRCCESIVRQLEDSPKSAFSRLREAIEDTSEVARLNSPHVSAGVADERAFDTEKSAVLFCEARGIDDENPCRVRVIDAFASGAYWQARADRPDHSAQGVPDVSAMARVLADRCADACNVDRDDYWKEYGQDCIEDVRAMLAAAPAPGKEIE